MNIAEIKSLKEDIYRVEMDDKLRSRIDDALVFFREKMEREENETLADKAYAMHIDIKNKYGRCWGDNKCQLCEYKEMCDAAWNLRKEIEKYNVNKIKWSVK